MFCSVPPGSKTTNCKLTSTPVVGVSNVIFDPLILVINVPEATPSEITSIPIKNSPLILVKVMVVEPIANEPDICAVPPFKLKAALSVTAKL